MKVHTFLQKSLFQVTNGTLHREHQCVEIGACDLAARVICPLGVILCRTMCHVREPSRPQTVHGVVGPSIFEWPGDASTRASDDKPKRFSQARNCTTGMKHNKDRLVHIHCG